MKAWLIRRLQSVPRSNLGIERWPVPRGGALWATGLFIFVVGCTIEAGSQSGTAAGIAEPGSGAASGSTNSRVEPSSGVATGPTESPLIVRVDTDRTLSATPGNGVGVFTEYRTGGHWHVWWTCDTNVTGHDCSFRVAVTPTTGLLANATGSDLSPLDTLAQAGDRLDVVTRTSVGAQGITFDAEPSAGVEVDAQLNGVRNGAFFFFVQDAIVNGGFTGPLSDPLVFQP